ncbi:MAG: glycoside hydrolase family 38 C-terminal domain-containing protein [Chloroflexota bacterium]
MSPQFLLDKLHQQLNLITQYRVRDRWQLPQLNFAETDSTISATRDWSQLNWQVLPYHQYWGKWSQSFTLRTQYQIPETWDLEGSCVLYFPLGDGGDGFEAHPEALIYVDGTAFTTTDVRHQEITLPTHLKDYQLHNLHLHGWTGLGNSLFGDDKPLLYLQPCELRLIDDQVHDFVVLAHNTLSAASNLADNHPIRHRLLTILRDSFRQIDTRHPISERFYQSIYTALPQLRTAIDRLNAPSDITIHAVGHAHIDTAWLWTLDITRGKAVRTFHTVLHLMERYPNYHFVQSQPQLYEYAREAFPDMFDSIKARVETGQWEPIGGMWVESDCNVPSGESLARQFLYGQRYFKDHFGAYTEVVWLPDTFGFSHTFPQIAKESGIKYFFTTKLRWNETNELPHDTFIWRGLDGSELLAHFTPTPMQHWLRMPTYNANLNAQAAIETYDRMHDKETMTRALMAYGWGDGGGGPTPEMLDNMTVLDNFPAIPHVRPSKAVDFFKAIEAEHDDKLPVWDGELYLETHQGTLTSQAWIKKANRQAEIALHDLEFLAVWADLVSDNYSYPQQMLEDLWKRVLLNQFHDILPGSSIKEVYDDAKRHHQATMQTLVNAHQEAFAILVQDVGGDVVLVNTTSYERQDTTFWQGGELGDDEALFFPDGTSARTQAVDNGLLIHLWDAPLSPYSLTSLTIQNASHKDEKDNRRELWIDFSDNYHLDNRWFRIVLDEQGYLNSLYDHITEVQFLEQHANQFQIFEDRPLRFDAWNIDPDFEDKMWLADPPHEIEIVENGQIRATLKIVRKVMNSTITQYISVWRESLRIDFCTHIDWQERNMLLKIAFPLSFIPNKIVTGTQWGETNVPTHRNTSWEQARYERPFQHYIKAMQGEQGVALLSDYKYGFDVKENVLRLTLLKGATYPDPTADLGEHEFMYSLTTFGTTHASKLNINDDVRYHATTLQYPILVSPSDAKTIKSAQSLFYLGEQSDNLVIETVKRGEDSDYIVVRVRETEGTLERHGTFEALHCLYPMTKAWLSNILEEPLEELSINSEKNSLYFSIKSYQVLTLLIEVEKPT